MAACRCWRSEAPVAKPTRPAIWSTERSLASSRCRACTTRCWISQRPGLMPTSSWKRRAKVRGLIRACAARSARARGSSRRPMAQARVAAVLAGPVSGTGCSMYCAWPPSRNGGTTQRRATLLASSLPWSLRTRCRQMSTPEAAPAEVSTRPSSTKRTSGSRSTCGYIRPNASATCQWVVARRPSRRPAAARTNAAVQMETMRAPGRIRASASATPSGSSAVIQSEATGATTTVAAVASASGPCCTPIVKSALVRTGRPSTEQVRIS